MVANLNNVENDRSTANNFSFNRRVDISCVIKMCTNLNETCIYIRDTIWYELNSSKTGKMSFSKSKFIKRNDTIQNGKNKKN